MLTVAKMGGGKADYYLTLAAEDYYVGRKSALEPEGYWLGAGADWKGLKGVVEATAFMHLFAGYAPDGKQRLVANAGQRGRMPGYDLTMAAPKSVSICWALSVGATRKGIEAAHQAAIAATVRKMEEAMKIRTGSGGKTTERAGLIAAVFQHATARQVDEHTPPDMHLHSHICVMNVGVTAQGKEGALDGRALLNAEFAKEYGAYYRAELAKGLYEMGFELVQTGGGFAIKGVKEELVAEFSKRARQIEEQLAKERQEASAKEKLKANHATREPKSRPDPKDIENHWHYTAKEKHHFTWETVERLRSKEQAVKRKSTPQERQAVVRAAAHELAEEKGAFSKRELRERALGAAGIKGLGASGMREAVDQYVKY
jgi:conjugative relaxase-like TrwC/TraI family protein